MPWKEVNVLNQRIEFVARAGGGHEVFTHLCREYGVSRTTGYLWVKRYREEKSLLSLNDKSRRPHLSPRKTSWEVEERVVALREQYGWGAKKLHVLLVEEGISIGVATVHRVLARRGLLNRKAQHVPHTKRFERSTPNELWQMDFKGEWGKTAKCYPLSIVDDHSRFAINLSAHPGPRGGEVQQALRKVFEQYGVPEAMLMDHGSPWFSTSNAGGLTYVVVGLLKQGIRLCYSGVRHPQTQGKVERFHRSLKDSLRHRGYPDAQNLEQCQHFLDRFREEYNEIRPHEALDMDRPRQHYRRSKRPYQPHPKEWDYPEGSIVMRLNTQGCLDYQGHRYFVCEALANERIRLWKNDGQYLIQYRKMFIRELNPKTGATHTLLTDKSPKV